MARPDAARRSDDATWSVLEYAAHVRDVLLLFAARLRLMREQDAPEFADWSRVGRRSNGSAFTTDTRTRSAMHDLVHHVRA